MSIADFASYRAKQAAPSRSIAYQQTQSIPQTTRMDSWLTMAVAGVAPTTPVVPTSETIGCPSFNLGMASLGTSRIVRVRGMRAVSGAGGNGTIVLYDRLSHSGGLSANVNTEQTTNLPTAAIPARDQDTTGVGVVAAVVLYATFGVTQATVTIKYTNSDGTAGQVSPAMLITTSATVRSLYLMPWAAGDKGVRSVESVTLSAASGTVGNMGVILLRPLAVIIGSTNDQDYDALLDGGLIPKLPVGACLASFLRVDGSNGTLSYKIDVAED